ncbi:S-layer homology domain-containing protein [Ructibacterium gallinarum]|uniref:S-layer homology domain-containing protein n=1 Tax=Ructibacterium gallinarum TaxID=2779355 RepID=A0A9D5M7P2_9FIRM|nr:S-layer homology domain-containing protein [Ructibacterium gallinarum]MBE5041072.1 S-layer homology domain-containing protein [Ructibacterium gallinarum]
MKMKKLKAALGALLATAMLGTYGCPTWAVETQTTPGTQTIDGGQKTEAEVSQQPETVELALSANYYTTETEGEYQIVFTTMDEIPAHTAMEFRVTFSGASIATAAFDEKVLNGAADEVVRGKDYAVFPVSRKEAMAIPAKTRLCEVEVSADAAPTAETLTVTDFTLTTEEGEISVTPKISLAEGPIVPELGQEEQAAYDSIAALPALAELSFYQEDGALISVADISAQFTQAQDLYDKLSKAEKANVEQVLEFNGLSTSALDEFEPVLNAMKNAEGILQIAYVLKDMTEETALNYQFLATVFDEKKESVSLVGLPAEYKAYQECEQTLEVLQTASDTIDAAFNAASEADDYETLVYACEDQIDVIQGLSRHIYYADYLEDLKTQIATLDKDITDNYDGRNKETLLELLNEAAEKVELIEKGVDDIPTMSLKEILYKRIYTITFTRKKTLADSQKSSITVVVTNEDGEEIDKITEEFPNDEKTLSISLSASDGYAPNAMITVSSIYTLDGAEFPIDSKEYQCVQIASNNPAPGIPSDSGGNSGSGLPGGSGGTVFPDDTEENDDENELGSGADELFGDLTGYDWAKEAIEGLYFAGIINGMEEGVFNPAGQVTREQFSKMVVQLFGVATGNTSTSFVDVDSNAWYAPYITAALQAGYIQGQSEEYFGIGESIMRQDMATILYRALGDNNSQAVLDFTDTDAIAPYAHDAIAELVGLGIINGYEDGSFQPRGTATRAEAAKMIWGVYQYLNE